MRPNTIKQKVAIVGNHFFYSTAIERIITTSNQFELVSRFENSSEFLISLERSIPDVVFWNVVHESTESPISHIQHISAMHPSLRIVCVSTHDEGLHVRTMLEAGVIAFITTNCNKEQYTEMLTCVYEQKKYISPTASMNYTLLMNDKKPETMRDKLISLLTKREMDVLRELVKGLTCKQIGLQLSLSYKTVEVHIQKMMRKFNVKKSLELVAIAVRYQLV